MTTPGETMPNGTDTTFEELPQTPVPAVPDEDDSEGETTGEDQVRDNRENDPPV